MFFNRIYATNEDLVNALKINGALITERIINAFKNVDRKFFVPEDKIDEAYGDYPLDIGQGQTVSQPTTVATMLELAYPKPGQKVLDVGSGSGWTSALLAEIVGPKGEVHATEIRPDLYELGKFNLAQQNQKNVTTHLTENVLGWPDEAPYDRILVSAAASDVPQKLLEQLAAPGSMVLPVDDYLSVVSKDKAGNVSQKKHYGYAFVPLIYQNA